MFGRVLNYHVLHSATRFLSFRAVLSLSFALCTSVPPLRCTFAFRATLSITFCSLNSSLRCRIVVFCTPRYVVAHTPHLCRQLCRLYSATPPHSRSAPAFSHSALRCRSHSEPLVPRPAFRCIVGSAPALCVRIRGDHCSCSLKVSHSPAVTAHVMITFDSVRSPWCCSLSQEYGDYTSIQGWAGVHCSVCVPLGSDYRELRPRTHN